jgi:hypothetical protein
MRYLYFFIFIFLLNCNNEKTVLLPEIENATVTEVLDVSPAYIFYDETEPDSTLLNRKNLIISTNWLVNIDKRLTLKQVIPHIVFLQNKKRNAELHKNEDAKNYFTCNDTSINNLGFLEFTTIYYKAENPNFKEFSTENTNAFTLINFFENGNFNIANLESNAKTIVSEDNSATNLSNFRASLSQIKYKNIVLFFEDDMTFQQYITIKSYFERMASDAFLISENEYVY